MAILLGAATGHALRDAHATRLQQGHLKEAAMALLFAALRRSTLMVSCLKKVDDVCALCCVALIELDGLCQGLDCPGLPSAAQHGLNLIFKEAGQYAQREHLVEPIPAGKQQTSTAGRAWMTCSWPAQGTPQEGALQAGKVTCQMREPGESRVGSKHMMVRGQALRPLSTIAQGLQLRLRCTGLVWEAGMPARGSPTSTFGW